MKKVSLVLMSFLLILLITGTGHALTVTTTSNPNVLVNNIIGSGLTVVSGSPTYTGDAVATGTFADGVASGIGIDSGIILTTGAAADAVGPNHNGSDPSEILYGTGTNFDAFDDTTGVNSGVDGYPALDALAGTSTFDGAILEFDFETIVAGDLSFDFVFASEEYLDFVARGFNDVFGFFLDGTNIALVPGTSSPISIDTISPIDNPVYYVNNVNPASHDIEYDGFTTVLAAESLGLTAGTHSMTLAIADGFDNLLDAAVFIEAGSFSFVTDEEVPPPAVPEPATMLLLGSGLVGLAGFRRKKFKK